MLILITSLYHQNKNSVRFRKDKPLVWVFNHFEMWLNDYLRFGISVICLFSFHVYLKLMKCHLPVRDAALCSDSLL